MSPTEQPTPPDTETTAPHWMRRAFGVAVAAAVFAVPAMAAANPGLMPGISPDRSASHRAEVSDARRAAPVVDADDDSEDSPETDDTVAARPVETGSDGDSEDSPETDGDETVGGETNTDETDAHEHTDVTDGDEADADENSTDETAARPDRQPRLSCEPNRADEGVVIGCKWTAVGEDRADGYRLVRSIDDGPRAVIFRTDDNRQHGHRDPVKPGHTYHYAVQYVDASGAVVFTSNAEHIRIPAPSDTPVLRCEAHRGDSSPAIGCEWTPASEDRAAGYRLLRSVDGGEREVVFKTENNREHGFKQVVRRGHTYHYAVQYVTADGSVIATSNTVTIELPAAPAEVEKLRIACEQTQRATADQRAVVACKWSAASADSVVGYKLIRRDAEGREVVARGGAEFLAHRESVAPGRYGYRVVGVDGQGAVVAASETVTVQVARPADEPSDRPTDTKPTDRPAEPTPSDRPGDAERDPADEPDDRSTDRREAATDTSSSANR